MDCHWREGRLVRWVLQLLKWKIILDEIKCRLEPTGFPSGAGGKEPTCQCRRYKTPGLNPWVRKTPWRRAWQPTPIFLPGESHGQRSLVGYSPGVAKSWAWLTRLNVHACTAYRRKDQRIWKHQLKLSITKYTHRKNTRKKKTFGTISNDLTSETQKEGMRIKIFKEITAKMLSKVVKTMHPQFQEAQ